jgi:pimeloyl-ACP methyl ester carboxylesterase
MNDKLGLGPPPLFLTLTETYRSAMELGALFASAPYLWFAPRGDGHKVIVLPGFSLGDSSTVWLRTYLTWLGYEVHGMGMGPNYGGRTVGADNARLKHLIERVRDGGKVSLVGHSLGGVLARQYARKHPDQVQRVICLGSPFAGDESSMHPGIVWFRRHLTGEDRGLVADRSPLPVPHTVVYSHGDGVVSAFDCVDVGDDPDNIQVPGSHIGLVVNFAAFRIVAERLADTAQEAEALRLAS